MDCYRYWSCGHVQEFQSSMKTMEGGEKMFSSEFDKWPKNGGPGPAQLTVNTLSVSYA